MIELSEQGKANVRRWVDWLRGPYADKATRNRTVSDDGKCYCAVGVLLDATCQETGITRLNYGFSIAKVDTKGREYNEFSGVGWTMFDLPSKLGIPDDLLSKAAKLNDQMKTATFEPVAKFLEEACDTPPSQWDALMLKHALTNGVSPV